MHEQWMHQALLEAELAAEMGDVPVGAVIVKDNKIIARGHNQVEQLKDPTAHAEIIAITAAAAEIGNWRLEYCRLYVTMEPCPMCAGAILNARIPELYYAVKDPKAGAVDSLYHLLEDPRFNHRCRIQNGLLKEQAETQLQNFFKILRQSDS
ncbi:MAG: tRNA adenosine(34) deaminase TadA [Candidatus Marinimicrobia bacterium]|nr:tRNA adenosine(34) deaminase TadA [Candidatus Neomarinimicrobiota bacterium]